jgi:hypothetical protein
MFFALCAAVVVLFGVVFLWASLLARRQRREARQRGFEVKQTTGQ